MAKRGMHDSPCIHVAFTHLNAFVLFVRSKVAALDRTPFQCNVGRNIAWVPLFELVVVRLVAVDGVGVGGRGEDK